MEFGYLTRSAGVGTYRWQLEAALTWRTAAIYHLPGGHEQALPLATVAEIAHERGIPVLVDGAAMPSSHELPEKLRSLPRRNAIRIDHKTFRSDVAVLREAVML